MIYTSNQCYFRDNLAIWLYTVIFWHCLELAPKPVGTTYEIQSYQFITIAQNTSVEIVLFGPISLGCFIPYFVL